MWGEPSNGCWSYSPTCLYFNLRGRRRSIFCCMAPSWCAALKRPRFLHQLTMNLNNCEPIQTFHFLSLQMGYFRLFLNIFFIFWIWKKNFTFEIIIYLDHFPPSLSFPHILDITLPYSQIHDLLIFLLLHTHRDTYTLRHKHTFLNT